MAKSVPYRYAAKDPVEWKSSKWDGFTLMKTVHEYRHQKGSGRSECFQLAKDGMPVGEWTRLCAESGFDSRFVTGSLLKIQGAKECAWLLSEKDDQGRTVSQVKSERESDPIKAQAKAEEAAKKAEERAARADERRAKQEADKARKAEEKALRDAAKAQADEASAEASEEADAPTKAPKRSKKKAAAVAEESEAA